MDKKKVISFIYYLAIMGLFVSAVSVLSMLLIADIPYYRWEHDFNKLFTIGGTISISLAIVSTILCFLNLKFKSYH